MALLLSECAIHTKFGQVVFVNIVICDFSKTGRFRIYLNADLLSNFVIIFLVEKYSENI